MREGTQEKQTQVIFLECPHAKGYESLGERASPMMSFQSRGGYKSNKEQSHSEEESSV